MRFDINFYPHLFDLILDGIGENDDEAGIRALRLTCSKVRDFVDDRLSQHMAIHEGKVYTRFGKVWRKAWRKGNPKTKVVDVHDYAPRKGVADEVIDLNSGSEGDDEPEGFTKEDWDWETYRGQERLNGAATGWTANKFMRRSRPDVVRLRDGWFGKTGQLYDFGSSTDGVTSISLSCVKLDREFHNPLIFCFPNPDVKRNIISTVYTTLYALQIHPWLCFDDDAVYKSTGMELTFVFIRDPSVEGMPRDADELDKLDYACNPFLRLPETLAKLLVLNKRVTVRLVGVEEWELEWDARKTSPDLPKENREVHALWSDWSFHRDVKDAWRQHHQRFNLPRMRRRHFELMRSRFSFLTMADFRAEVGERIYGLCCRE